MKIKLILPLIFCALFFLSCSTSNRYSELYSCQVGEKKDLGLWDDIYSYESFDFLVLRKESELFSLSLTSTDDIKKLPATPDMTDTSIIDGSAWHGRQWLFCQSKNTVPFALDLQTGDIAYFNIPGLKVPGERTPTIQSSVFAEHAGGVIFEIASGDRDTWPRPNYPIYFWFSLESGKNILLPIGWDLQYFSADQRIAILKKAGGSHFDSQSYQAINMTTGQISDNVPDRRSKFTIPFVWTNNDRAKPLEAPESYPTRFGGISVNGSAYTFDIPIEIQRFSYITIKAKGNWAAFRIPTSSIVAPAPLWWMHLEKGEKPNLLRDNVLDFQVLGKGNYVLAVSGYGFKKDSSEAFIYDTKTNRMRNILDGVERLPKLNVEIPNNGCVADKMIVRLASGFGSSRYAKLVLCFFLHSRGTACSHAYIDGQVVPSIPPVPEQRWQRIILVTDQGKRFQANILEPGDFDGPIGLHNSGKIVFGRYEWSGEEPNRAKKIQLYLVDLNIE